MHTPYENRKYGLIESAHIKPIQSLTELPDRNTFFGISSRSPRSGFVVRKFGLPPPRRGNSRRRNILRVDSAEVVFSRESRKRRVPLGNRSPRLPGGSKWKVDVGSQHPVCCLS